MPVAREVGNARGTIEDQVWRITRHRAGFEPILELREVDQRHFDTGLRGETIELASEGGEKPFVEDDVLPQHRDLGPGERLPWSVRPRRCDRLGLDDRRKLAWKRWARRRAEIATTLGRRQDPADLSTRGVHELGEGQIQDAPRSEWTRNDRGRTLRDRVFDVGLLHRPVERLDGLSRYRFIDRSTQGHCSEREDDAQIGVDPEVGERGARQPRHPGFAGLAFGLPSAVRRDSGETRGDQSCDREHGYERSETTDGTALERALPSPSSSIFVELALALAHTRGQVLVLVTREGEFRGRLPRAQFLQTPPSEQQAWVPARALPIGSCDGESSMLAEVVLCTVDPHAQSIPRAEQRLVGDLDGRAARGRVAIEGEQAVTTEHVDHASHRRAIDLEGEELGSRHEPPRIRRAFAGDHEPQEELLRGLAFLLAHRLVQLLGTSHQCAGDPTDLPVRLERHRVAATSFEELGEGVLQQGECARSIGHVRDHLRDERELGDDSDPRRGAPDRPLELLGRQRYDGLHAGPHQLRESRERQRTVVEVGPERDDDPEARSTLKRRGDEALQEPVSGRLLLDHREDLFQLIDDEHQLASVVGQEAIDQLDETSLAPFQELEHVVGRVDGDPLQRPLELFHRMATRQHLEVEPSVRAGESPCPEGRDETGAHHGGLPAPRRPDHGEEPRSLAGLGHPGDQAVDEGVAAEEVLRVGLGERVEPLVGVALPDLVVTRAGPRDREVEGLAKSDRHVNGIPVPAVGIVGRGTADHFADAHVAVAAVDHVLDDHAKPVDVRRRRHFLSA